MGHVPWTARRQFLIAGVRINAYTVSTGSPAFLLVHGLGTSPRYFEPLAAVLSSAGTVIAVELPGFGRTPKLRRVLDMQDFADTVSGVLDELGVESAVLIGHSMGAQIVAEMAVRRPDQALRLVLLGPTTDNRQRSVLQQAVRLGLDTLRESAGANRIVFTDYRRAGTRWYLSILSEMRKHRIESVLPDVTCPVHLVRGEYDPVAPHDWLERLQQVCPRASVTEVAGAPHVVMYRDPEAVARTCRQIGAPQ